VWGMVVAEIHPGCRSEMKDNREEPGNETFPFLAMVPHSFPWVSSHPPSSCMWLVETGRHSTTTRARRNNSTSTAYGDTYKCHDVIKIKY
jgi:hypothetical protein